MPNSSKQPKRWARVRNELEKQGLLLVTDTVLPSVSALVAGEMVKGSWWSHPAAGDIFAVLERLEDEPDALLVKFLSGKQTFLHQSLWREFFSIAAAKSPWQTKGLSAEDRSLLRQVEKKSELQVGKRKSELESRLLVHGKSVHTESGAHAKVYETWQRCASTKNFRYRLADPEACQALFEQRIDRWSTQFGKKATFPWPQNADED